MESKHLSPLKSIRAKCIECAGGKPSLVRHCESTDCALHFYRLGKNPNRKGIGPGIGAQKGAVSAKIANPAQVSGIVLGSKGSNEASEVFQGQQAVIKEIVVDKDRMEKVKILAKEIIGITDGIAD